ncbi:invasion associated locus B family protein [Acidisoma sp. 7E03]
MKIPLSAAIGLLMLATAPAHAAEHVARFKDWAVSSYTAKGHRICYSFTQALRTHHGKGRCGVAVLVVTHAPPRHDRVVLSPCQHYGAGQKALTMGVGTKHLGFHTRGQYAYANESDAAIAAFRRGMKAHVPGPAGSRDEVFSLRGFAAAYDAMRKTCVG